MTSQSKVALIKQLILFFCPNQVGKVLHNWIRDEDEKAILAPLDLPS